MACPNCKSEKIAHVTAKCSDMCIVSFPDETESEGYVPSKIGIGSGDYIEFSWCMSCGMIQDDSFPVGIPDKE